MATEQNKKKIGVVKKVLKLNTDYDKLPTSDLQGIVMGLAVRTVPDNRMLQSEVENRLLEILNTTAGCTSSSCEEYIKSQVGFLKEQLRAMGYTIL